MRLGSRISIPTLTSDQASYVNGACFAVDGGQSA